MYFGITIYLDGLGVNKKETLAIRVGTPTTTLYTYTYATSTHTQRQYIGEYYQPESELSYLNARWYDGDRGQFLSQDPVFWEVGLTQDGKSVLANPQAQNSYSYGSNNPITHKDPSGRFAIGIGGTAGGNVPGIYGQGSTFLVMTISRTHGVEIGLISSGEGGGTTAILGGEFTGNFLFSPNSQSIGDLEGVDVGGGASVKAGLNLGVDISTSREDENGKRITTMTGSVGAGGAVTPYVLPVEFHGGVSYSKSLGSVNISQSFRNAYNFVQNRVSSTYASIQNQLNDIKAKVDSIKVAINQLSKKPDSPSKR